MCPETVFLTPKNVLHRDIAAELGAKIIGVNSGHLWEQADLPLYLSRKGHPPLFSPANTAPVLYSNNYFTLHDLAFYHHPEWNTKAFSTWYNVLIPRLVFGCKHIFTVSQAIRDEIIKYYKVSPAKVSLTYNGISAQMEGGINVTSIPKEKIILCVGTFNRRKNHQNLVKAFIESRVKDEYQLVLIGDKNKVFAESGVDEQLLVNTNIKIYERLTSEELIGMYYRAEVLVSLSVYEGFGIPVLEGLYAGCKVVCSDIPVYRELYDGYVSFCDPYDVKNISQALEAVASKPANNDKERLDALFEKYNYTRSAQTIIDTIGRG